MRPRGSAELLDLAAHAERVQALRLVGREEAAEEQHAVLGRVDTVRVEPQAADDLGHFGISFLAFRKSAGSTFTSLSLRLSLM